MPITIGVISISAGVLAHVIRTSYNMYIKPRLNSGKSPSVPEKSFELRVLGFPNSGKTQFLNALRGIPNTSEKIQTIGKEGVVDIPLIRFTKNDGQVRKFRSKDINGSKEFLVKNTKDFVEDADYLLFCCDIISYLQNRNDYRNKANGVLRAIQELSKSKNFICVRIILTYEDKLQDLGLTPKQAVIDFKKHIENTEYGKFQCYTVNTFDQQQVKQVFNRIIQ